VLLPMAKVLGHPAMSNLDFLISIALFLGALVLAGFLWTMKSGVSMKIWKAQAWRIPDVR